MTEYEDFYNKMVTNYPKMFPEPFRGFAIGKGWYHIIEALCGNIQRYIDFKNSQKETSCEQLVVLQIKEKFSGLRFYSTGGDEYTSGMITMAESWAQHTCEQCGERGSTRRTGWISTLCDKHYNERKGT